VAIYGAGGVGKSSIVNRFIRNQFNSAYVPTIEDTYQQAILSLLLTYIVVLLQVITSNQKICMLQIIDTTGSHQFPAMQRLSIAKAHAFVSH
jgi:small GTP-binding protein